MRGKWTALALAYVLAIGATASAQTLNGWIGAEDAMIVVQQCDSHVSYSLRGYSRGTGRLGKRCLRFGAIYRVPNKVAM